MIAINSQYNVAAPDSLPVRVAARQRRRMYEVFTKVLKLPDETATILDIGVTSDRTYPASNYIEAWYPHKHRITASGIDDASFLTEVYPGMQFCFGDATALQFADRSFDVVHSSAVIEHVGSSENQEKLVAECARVCRRGFFVTTPNRWFPVEFHTVLPVVHWLPKPAFRALMRRTGRDFFADEKNLNLMTKNELLRILASARLSAEFDLAVATVSLLGWPSNLLLYGLRRNV